MRTFIPVVVTVSLIQPANISVSVSYFFRCCLPSHERAHLLSALTKVTLLQLSILTNAAFATPRVRSFGHRNIDVVLAADWMLRC